MNVGWIYTISPTRCIYERGGSKHCTLTITNRLAGWKVSRLTWGFINDCEKSMKINREFLRVTLRDCSKNVVPGLYWVGDGS